MAWFFSDTNEKQCKKLFFALLFLFKIWVEKREKIVYNMYKYAKSI